MIKKQSAGASPASPPRQPSEDWQPDLYLRFVHERTQPPRDLAARVGLPLPRRVIDIGCGPGNSTAVLRDKWPDAELVAIDNSESMLAKAGESGCLATWLRHDISDDLTDLGSFDVVFSNGVLQWVENLPVIIPKLYAMVAEGGVLAFQVPDMNGQPRNKVLAQLAASSAWSACFGGIVPSRHRPYEFYYRILSGLEGKLEMWRTEYIHIFPAADSIVTWARGSGLRVYLNALPDDDSRERFLTAYTEAVRAAYPAEPDGNVLFPFPRLFFLLAKC